MVKRLAPSKSLLLPCPSHLPLVILTTIERSVPWIPEVTTFGHRNSTTVSQPPTRTEQQYRVPNRRPWRMRTIFGAIPFQQTIRIECGTHPIQQIKAYNQEPNPITSKATIEGRKRHRIPVGRLRRGRSRWCRPPIARHPTGSNPRCRL